MVLFGPERNSGDSLTPQKAHVFLGACFLMVWKESLLRFLISFAIGNRGMFVYITGCGMILFILCARNYFIIKEMRTCQSGRVPDV
jgi:hypothetical protein